MARQAMSDIDENEVAHAVSVRDFIMQSSGRVLHMDDSPGNRRSINSQFITLIRSVQPVGLPATPETGNSRYHPALHHTHPSS